MTGHLLYLLNTARVFRNPAYLLGVPCFTITRIVHVCFYPFSTYHACISQECALACACFIPRTTLMLLTLVTSRLGGSSSCVKDNSMISIFKFMRLV